MGRPPDSVLFLVRSLDRGGAERQVVTLAKGLAERGHPVSIAVFYSGGAYEADLAHTGVRLLRLNKGGRWDIPGFLFRLAWLLRREHPALLHAYLGIPNILAVLMKPLLHGTRIVWGVRASKVELAHYDNLSRLAYWLECRLSRFADLVIANSRAGKAYAVTQGFPEQRLVVIPNGIDSERFRFDPQGRARVRAQWGIRDGEVMVGLVARIDPMKDHVAFLQATALLTKQSPGLRFVCVGNGTATDALKRRADLLGINDRLLWAESRDDMPAVFSALDVASSTSAFGEGFSNTIAEAMACGRPCVVTDVGDSALIVGALGEVVTPGDHQALASAIMRLAQLSGEERRKLGDACRARIVAEFGVERMVTDTERLLGLAT